MLIKMGKKVGKIEQMKYALQVTRASFFDDNTDSKEMGVNWQMDSHKSLDLKIVVNFVSFR